MILYNPRDITDPYYDNIELPAREKEEDKREEEREMNLD